MASESASSGTTDVKVPPVGESITEAVVVEWLVAVGAPVLVDQDLVTLETDKITVNVPSPASGVLAEHLVKPGDKVEIGALIARIVSDGSHVAAAPAAPAAPVVTAAPVAPAPAPAAHAAPAASHDDGLMPAVRKLLVENGLGPADVRGTGPKGRILKEDVLRTLDERKAGARAPAREAAPKPAPAPASTPKAAAPAPTSNLFSEPSGRVEEEVVPMSKLRQTIARRLVEAQHTAAILTTFNEVDMSAVTALRNQYKDAFEKAHGVRLGFLGFFAKAVVEALKAFPSVNAEVRGDAIVYKHHYDLGVAVGGGKGLVVPVVRSVDELSFSAFEKQLAALADKAKNNTLSLAELQGGTFTISNGGVYGSLLSTPILNPPQVGILGLHKVEDRPVAVNGQVVIRPMMYVALSYDHRIVDGREAVGFLVKVKQCIEDPARILLEV